MGALEEVLGSLVEFEKLALNLSLKQLNVFVSRQFLKVPMSHFAIIFSRLLCSKESALSNASVNVFRDMLYLFLV